MRLESEHSLLHRPKTLGEGKSLTHGGTAWCTLWWVGKGSLLPCAMVTLGKQREMSKHSRKAYSLDSRPRVYISYPPLYFSMFRHKLNSWHVNGSMTPCVWAACGCILSWCLWRHQSVPEHASMFPSCLLSPHCRCELFGSFKQVFSKWKS